MIIYNAVKWVAESLDVFSCAFRSLVPMDKISTVFTGDSLLYDISIVNMQGYTGVLNVIEYAAGFVPVFLYNNQVIATPSCID